MIASVHIADDGPLRTLTRRTPRRDSVPGLRWSHKALCGRLGPGALPDVQPGRSGMVAWWDDDASLDRFLAQDERAAAFADAWSVRLRPTRTRAKWPGMEDDPFPHPGERHEGVHAAITLGTAYLRTLPRFLRISSELEEQFLADDGGIWGVGVNLPPRIVMTFTFWEDQDATDAFVRSGAHGRAMASHYDFPTDDHEFISEGGFFGFQPYAMSGTLTGENPVPRDLADRCP